MGLGKNKQSNFPNPIYYRRKKAIMKLDVKNLAITDHAVERATERFGRRSKADALNYCKSILGSDSCKYIGVVTGEDGKEAHLYSNGKINIYLSMNLEAVVTLMEVKDRAYHPSFSSDHPLKRKLLSIYEKEIRKYDRTEATLKKKIYNYKFEYDVQVAQLRHRIHKTRSKTVKEDCQKRIAELDTQMKNIENTLGRIVEDKRVVAKAMTALL
jgi:hypothetical protein